MQADVARYADIVVLNVAGEVNGDSGEAFREQLLGMIARLVTGTSGIVIDLGSVPYISSVGLSALMAGAKECGKRHVKLVLASLQPMVREVLQISRFDLMMPTFDDLSAALASLSPAAKKAYDEGRGA